MRYKICGKWLHTTQLLYKIVLYCAILRYLKYFSFHLTFYRISNLIQIQFFAHKTWQSYKIWYTDLTISNIKYLKLATTVTTMCILLNIKKKICNNDNIMLFFIWWFICINIYFVYCFLFLFFLLISEVRHIFKHYLRLMKLLVITVYWK